MHKQLNPVSMFLGLTLGMFLNFLIIDTFNIISYSSQISLTIICATFSAILSASRRD